MKEKKYFSEGDEVAHKDKLLIKMTVERIVKYKKKVTVCGQKEKIEKNFLAGIACGWWKGDDYVHEVFFSTHLVPWGIAEQGKEKVIEWLEKN